MDERPAKWVSIPHEILSDTNLSFFEKVLWGEIQALERDGAPCYAGNQHFEELFSCDKATVSKAISHLNSVGYLIVSYTNENTKNGRYMTTLWCTDQTPFGEKVKGFGENTKGEDIHKELNSPKEKEKENIKEKESAPPLWKEVNYLKLIPPEDIDAFSLKFDLPREKIVREAEFAYDWVHARGLLHKFHDWKAFFRNWLRKAKSGFPQKVELPSAPTTINPTELNYFQDKDFNRNLFETYELYMEMQAHEANFSEEDKKSPGSNWNYYKNWHEGLKKSSMRVYTDILRRYKEKHEPR